MSYDILITKSDDPYAEPRDLLSVRSIVEAVNKYPPFAERGITWKNSKWNDHPAWEGLTIDLEGHDPERISQGKFDDQAGTSEGCRMHISYGTDSDLHSCLELARRIARAADARAWDLQSNCELSALSRNGLYREWDRIREKFRWLLRPEER